MENDTSSDAAGEAAGVRAFLIADVRGYTRYSDEYGDEAASALARRFAAIANEAVGHEAVRSSSCAATRRCASSRPRARRCEGP
jgi:class 3 adenylate cyclase